jgi:hypothetical protein
MPDRGGTGSTSSAARAEAPASASVRPEPEADAGAAFDPSDPDESRAAHTSSAAGAPEPGSLGPRMPDRGGTGSTSNAARAEASASASVSVRPEPEEVAGATIHSPEGDGAHAVGAAVEGAGTQAQQVIDAVNVAATGTGTGAPGTDAQTGRPAESGDTGGHPGNPARGAAHSGPVEARETRQVPGPAPPGVGAAEGERPLHEAGRATPAGDRHMAAVEAGREPLVRQASSGAGDRPPRASARAAELNGDEGGGAVPEGDGLGQDGAEQDGDLPREGRAPTPPRESGATGRSARALQSALAFVHGADGAPAMAAALSTGAASAAPSMTPQERAANISQLVRSMQVLVRNGIGEVTVRLRPEHLGDVSILIRVDGKSVSATVRAESQSVREWLLSQEDALRAGLAQQGLTLDRLVVQRDTRHDRGDREPPQARRPRTRRHPGGSERFEVSA